MSKYFLDVLILTAVCLSWFNGSGFALNIDISPNKVNGLVHNDVTIRCSLDKADVDVKEIMVFELSKGDKRIAILRLKTKLSVGVGLDSKFKAEGNISEPAFNSYIHVTLTNPDTEDSGAYTCIMYYLDQLGILKETRNSASLSISDQDVQSALKYLVIKVSDLEAELTHQKTDHMVKISILKTEHNVSIALLEEDFKRQINNYRTALEDQKDESIANQVRVSSLESEINAQKRNHETEIHQLETNLERQKAELNQLREDLEQQDKDYNATITELMNSETEMKVQKRIFKTEINQLETNLNRQKSEFNQKLEKMEQQDKDHSASITESMHKEAELTGQLEKQTEALKQLSDKDNKTVAFLAVHTRSGTISAGQDMVYSDVIENIGGGYNGNTGVFTAPVDGFYLLSVSVTPNSGKEIRLELTSSKSGVLSRLYAYYSGGIDYEDTTCVSRLEAGERVRPHVRGATSGTTLWGEDSQDRLDKFYGYLIKMV